MVQNPPLPRTNPEAIQRKAYKVGGSTAVRLPKDLAEECGIAPGTPVVFKRKGRGILVEPAQ